MTQISLFRMAVLVSIAALATTARGAANTASPIDLPANVKYERAPQPRLEQAATALRAALAQGPEALASMLGGHSNSERVLMGPFFSIQAVGEGLDVLGYLKRFSYTAIIDAEGTKFQAPGLFGETPEQKRLLAQYLFMISDRHPSGQVRAANFDELSMIWYWISWDLDEPLYVYEAGNERLVFDFDPKSGRITWIERLTEPCFSGLQEDKEVLGCTCMHVERDKQDWRVRMRSMPVCATIADVPLKASATITEAEPGRKRIVLQLSERTRRVDRIVAKLAAPDYALLVLPDGAPNYQGVGKLISGEPPAKPVDASGKPIKGYVLVMHVIDSAGAASDNRPMLYSDDRLLAAVIAAAKTWRLEPAKLDGVAVSEVVWQQFEF